MNGLNRTPGKSHFPAMLMALMASMAHHPVAERRVTPNTFHLGGFTKAKKKVPRGGNPAGTKLAKQAAKGRLGLW
jgi:hypothetical protein